VLNGLPMICALSMPRLRRYRRNPVMKRIGMVGRAMRAYRAT
jgi:hypothetical protein